MTRYVAVVDSTLSPEDAFAFMSDMRLFPSWDPMIVRAVQVSGQGPGADAVVDLTFGPSLRLSTLRYRVTVFDPPRSMVMEGRNRWLSSHDEVSVEPAAAGSRVTYSAEVRMSAPAPVGTAVLGLPLRVMGDRAAAGLRAVLRPEGAAHQ